MARVFKESHSFTCTPRVHRLTEGTIPAFTFPAEAGTHLPNPLSWYWLAIRQLRQKLNANYAVKGYSRSPILVAIKSTHASSYPINNSNLAYILSCAVSEISRIIGKDFPRQQWGWLSLTYLFWVSL